MHSFIFLQVTIFLKFVLAVSLTYKTQCLAFLLRLDMLCVAGGYGWHRARGRDSAGGEFITWFGATSIKVKTAVKVGFLQPH